MKVELKDAIGVGFAFISEEHIFTFLLSSPFTARTIVKEKNQIDQVKVDLEISLILSLTISFILGYIFQSESTSIAGIVFGLLLYLIYAWRGELL